MVPPPTVKEHSSLVGDVTKADDYEDELAPLFRKPLALILPFIFFTSNLKIVLVTLQNVNIVKG